LLVVAAADVGVGSPRSDPPAFAPTPPPAKKPVSEDVVIAPSELVIAHVVAPSDDVVAPSDVVVAPSDVVIASPASLEDIASLSSPDVREIVSDHESDPHPRPPPPVSLVSREYLRSPGSPSPARSPLAAVDTAVTMPFRDGPTKVISFVFVFFWFCFADLWQKQTNKSVIMARPKGKQKNPNRRSKSLDLTRALVEAASLGDVARMKALLSHGAKLNGTDAATGNTPLIAAVLVTHTKTHLLLNSKYFCQKGCRNDAIMFLLDQPDINVNKPNLQGNLCFDQHFEFTQLTNQRVYCSSRACGNGQRRRRHLAGAARGQRECDKHKRSHSSTAQSEAGRLGKFRRNVGMKPCVIIENFLRFFQLVLFIFIVFSIVNLLSVC
jgi:hypothetical protein